MEMTYNDYDALLEKFAIIKDKKKVPVYWPTIQQIDKFQEDPDYWIQFCCYLYECNPTPVTSADKYSKKNLAQFISDNLLLIDD